MTYWFLNIHGEWVKVRNDTATRRRDRAILSGEPRHNYIRRKLAERGPRVYVQGYEDPV